MIAGGDFRKLLAIGTGVGVEIGRAELNIAVARVRPTGVRVLGLLSIHNYREQPAAEWGAVYSKFLKKLGARYLTATVLLPREDVIVRQVALPGVSTRDIPAALAYQIDSLHPYSDEEAHFAWARIGKSANVLVGITRRAVIERYSALFAEAGIKVSAFTFPAAAMYSAVRLYAAPPAGGFVAIDRPVEPEGEPAAGSEREPGYEVYGESEAHPIFSAHLELPEERVLALALSELRLPPETAPVAFGAILPQPAAAPAGEEMARRALPYATAVAGACPRLSLPLNMLPEPQRAARSRWIYVPTIALASLFLLALGALAAHGEYENRRYVAALQKEIQRVQPRAQHAADLDRAIANARNRAQTLDNFRLRAKEDMDALNDLTRILAPPTWLNGLQLTRTSVAISGEADRAAPILKALDGTRQFKRSEFTLPISRTAGGESFSIHAERAGVTP